MPIAWPFSKTRLNIIQLMTGFEYNSKFVWPSNGSVDRRRSLRATDPFEGQTKLLLFEKPVYNSFVIHLHFFKIFLFTLSTDISMRCFQNPRPSSPRIWTTPWHCYINITWLIEPMKIMPSGNSSIAGNRSINCWPNCFATNRDFVVNSHNIVYLLYCFYIGEKMTVYNKVKYW